MMVGYFHADFKGAISHGELRVPVMTSGRGNGRAGVALDQPE